jgi:hypothetical protein
MKLVLTIGTIILSFVTLFLGFVFAKSLTYPYNSEGRYFDEASATVHHEQAVGIYGIMVFCGLVLTLLTLCKTRKVFTNERMATKSN